MRIAVLGPLQVLIDAAAPVPLPGPTERLLLAALVAGAPGAVSTDDLLALLPDTTESSLRYHLGRLRRALEPGLPDRSSGQYVQRRGPGYLLTVGPSDIDALRFGSLVERARSASAADEAAHAVDLLTTALGLWRGEPYADWPDTAFAAAERRRLAALRAEAIRFLDEARRRSRESPGPRPAPPLVLPVTASPAARRGGSTPADPTPPEAPERAPFAEELALPPRAPSGTRTRTRRAAAIGALVAALVVAGVAVRDPRDGSDRSPAAATPDEQTTGTIVGPRYPLDVSLLLTVAAVRADDTPATHSLLLGELGRLGRVDRVVPFAGLPGDPVLSGGRVLTLRTDRRIVEWTIGPVTQPRVLMGIPGEWGAWYVTTPSPTEPVVYTAGENLAGPWLRAVSADDGTSRVLASADQLGGRPVAGVVTPDGRRVHLLLGDPGDVARWRMVDVDAADGSVRVTGPAGVVPAAADALAADFSDDASTLVVWDVTRAAPATLVDVATGARTTIANPPTTAGFRALPTGAAELGNDGTVRLVDGGGAVQELDAHDGQVRDVAVSPDRTWAVTAGDGGEVVRWDVDPTTGTWSRPEPLAGHVGGVVGLEAGPDGATLVSVSLDNRVIVWDMRRRASIRQDRARRLPSMNAAASVAEACAVVGRDLSPAEWRAYLPDEEYRPTCSDLL